MRKPIATAMPGGAAAALRDLERWFHAFDRDAAPRKLAALAVLARRRLASAAQVRRLHEALCFLRAYPDDPAVLAAVEAMLAGFERRTDLRRHRAALAETGIAGTDIHYRFFWFTAEWLAHRWPDRLAVDWPAFENRAELVPLLRLLVPYAEAAAVDDVELPPRRWVERWRGSQDADGTFLVRRFAALRCDSFLREAIYEKIDPPLALRAGPTTPSRTRARVPGAPAVFRTRPLDRARPDLRRAAAVPPQAVRAVPPRAARQLVDLAREAMVTRSRDLDSFEHADPDDVRIADCGEGLQFAVIGLLPERRALFDAVYGYLTLQNGVPIGYVLSSALFESAVVAYNVFETFRGAEAARNYGRVLGMVRHLFGATTFAVDPYQLGHDNAEGLASGAWWFYRKLGFRPVDPEVVQLVLAEEARLRRNPRHRSNRATLQRLSAAHVFFHLGRPRADVLGRVALGRVSERASEYISRRFGADREAGLRACAGEAARLVGVGAWRRWPSGERLAWERWAPIVLLLPDVRRWSATEKLDLAAVVRAKGGRRESDFVRRFDAHRRLRRAVLALARAPRASLDRAR